MKDNITFQTAPVSVNILCSLNCAKQAKRWTSLNRIKEIYLSFYLKLNNNSEIIYAKKLKLSSKQQLSFIDSIHLIIHNMWNLLSCYNRQCFILPQYAINRHHTHRRQALCARELGVLIEHGVWVGPQQQEDVDDTALAEPVRLHLWDVAVALHQVHDLR